MNGQNTTTLALVRRGLPVALAYYITTTHYIRENTRYYFTKWIRRLWRRWLMEAFAYRRRAILARQDWERRVGLFRGFW